MRVVKMPDEVLIPRSRAALWAGLCAAAAVRGCSCAAVAVFCALAPAARSAVVAPLPASAPVPAAAAAPARTVALLPAAAPASSTAQSYPYVAGFTYVKSLDRIEEYRLDSNGLSVL